MFIVFGDRDRTEPLAGGLVCTRLCPRCGVPTTFREHVISKQFRVYFVDMFTHDSHHVLACGACGTMYVTDEMKARGGGDDQKGTVYGALQAAARKGQDVARGVTDGRLERALEQTGASVGEAARVARKRLGGLLGRLRGDR